MGLNVAVDDAAAVRVLERLGDLRGKMQRLAPVELPLLLHVLLEGDALDQFHNDIIEIIRVRHVIYAHDIRVGEHGDGLRLGVEAPPELRVLRQLFFQYFNGDQTVQPVAARLVDDRHPARADHIQYFISVIQ